ncbi:class I SAM-dependent methyltransferase [uncultured Dialister sp.]|jgi:SAM-dependent methyltransferase|uniref:class I SAM-dependent methyltransferase n=1 Tax=Dialister succinatiphilus TaxID=487173 RepID=UPI00265CF961|nr:class I SAM-dependent methyltransferase [uncultured Dialister sp.]
MKTLLKKSFPFHAGPKAEGYLLSASNLWNTPLSLWGLSQVTIPEDAEILEIGCGGGKNLERLLKKAPKGHVSGIDSSFRAVDFAYRQNEKAIREGRCSVYEGAPDVLPFNENKFDFVLAAESFYFWKDPEACLKEVLRVMKPGASLLILQSKGGLSLHRIYEKLIPGMKVYGREDLKELLEDAGFRDVTIRSRLGALAVVSEKPVTPLDTARKKLRLSSIPYGKLTAAALSVAALGLAAYGASRKYRS